MKCRNVFGVEKCAANGQKPSNMTFWVAAKAGQTMPCNTYAIMQAVTMLGARHVACDKWQKKREESLKKRVHYVRLQRGK